MYKWNIQVKDNTILDNKSYMSISDYHTVTDINTGKIYTFNDMITLKLFFKEKYKIKIHNS